MKNDSKDDQHRVCTPIESIKNGSNKIIMGRGLIKGHPLEVIYRKIRSMRLAGGATDVLRLSVSKGALEFDAGIL